MITGFKRTDWTADGQISKPENAALKAAEGGMKDIKLALSVQFLFFEDIFEGLASFYYLACVILIDKIINVTHPSIITILPRVQIIEPVFLTSSSQETTDHCRPSCLSGRMSTNKTHL